MASVKEPRSDLPDPAVGPDMFFYSQANVRGLAFTRVLNHAPQTSVPILVGYARIRTLGGPRLSRLAIQVLDNTGPPRTLRFEGFLNVSMAFWAFLAIHMATAGFLSKF